MGQSCALLSRNVLVGMRKVSNGESETHITTKKGKIFVSYTEQLF